MGIKDLNSIIKKEAPNSIGTVSLDYFNGKKIAVDGHNLIYKNMAVARKIVSKRTNFAVDDIDEGVTRNEWLKLCINFAVKLMKNFITPIFIFDGPEAPGKEETKQKRREIRKEAESNFNEKRRQLSEMDALDRTPELIKEIQDDYNKYVDLKMDDVEYLYTCLSNLGIPWMQSRGEAEKLCTMLCREGKVAAVFSRDTDNLAMGCPLLITDFASDVFKDGKNVPAVIFFEYHLILEDLELNPEEFQDLCILLECDYNKRIPKVGPVNALKLIREHRSISEISKIKDTSCLNYEACIKNFSPVDSDELLMRGNMELRCNPVDEMRDILDNIGLSGLTHQLCTSISACLNFEDEIAAGLIDFEGNSSCGSSVSSVSRNSDSRDKNDNRSDSGDDNIKEDDKRTKSEDIRNRLSLLSFADNDHDEKSERIEKSEKEVVKQKKKIKIRSGIEV